MKDIERLYAGTGSETGETRRRETMLRAMPGNKAYIHAAHLAGGDPDGAILKDFRARYLAYRSSWRGQPARAISGQPDTAGFRKTCPAPLCVDIETASLCDLACPFCYRQSIATPDSVMHEDLFHTIIDQCAALGVPSIKLNWRGEPLLNPKLPKFVAYAKKAGILEVIINSNALRLNEAMAGALVEAGLDMIIYSFDGGRPETYERMRPGRFRPNHFDTVYGNIRRFHQIRTTSGKQLPWTKIQMILTQNNERERDSFLDLFSACVDEVSFKAYSERGGKLADLAPVNREALDAFIAGQNLETVPEFWIDASGGLRVAVGRLPCEQPFQRLMVAHDGRVCMCCYDWGCSYPVGVVSTEAIALGDRRYVEVIKRAQAMRKGYTFGDLHLPERYLALPETVQSLAEIWHGDRINTVRNLHATGNLAAVPLCASCPFKDTYAWMKVGEA